MMGALVFLDCEFTQFIHVELLSLGMVTLADETREMYVELDMSTDIGKARRAASSDFVKYEGVLDQWGTVPGATATDWEMGRRAGEWLLALAEESGTRVEVAYDYGMDWELLEYAVRDSGLWDRGLEVAWPVDVGALTGTIHGELAAEKCYLTLKKRGLGRHHALADAHALRSAFVATKDLTLRLARFGATPDFHRLVAAADVGAERRRKKEPMKFGAEWNAAGWTRQWLTDQAVALRDDRPLDIIEGSDGADHLEDFIRSLARSGSLFVNRNVLFIDLDGVVYRAHRPGELTIATAGYSELLEERPDLFGWSHHLATALEGHRCDLIVHSSWRAYLPDTDLRAILPSCIRHRFAGTTQRNVAREESILMAARAMQLEDDGLLVVDDEPEQFETLRHRLVVCDPTAGVTTPGVTDAIATWLNRPRPRAPADHAI